LHTADFRTIAFEDLKPMEKIAYRALNGVLVQFWRYYQETCIDMNLDIVEGYAGRRRLQVGESEVGEAWTDGAQYITLRRDLIESVYQGLDAVIRVLLILLHEACHDAASVGTHDHNLEFYERYHAVSLHPEFKVARLAATVLNSITMLARDENRKLHKKTMESASFTEATVEADAPLKLVA